MPANKSSLSWLNSGKIDPMTGIREIVFDTETTGFDAKGEDRITEIGAIEIIDLVPTGESFHTYLDPQREVPAAVVEITGLTTEFLKGKPLFKDQAKAFLDFVGDSQLVAHNADFDRGFINAELARAGFDPVPNGRFTDTLKIARSKFPGSPASLDALCKRFNISLTSRDKHGALIDAELLAEVYLDLRGGRIRKLGLGDDIVQDTARLKIPTAKPRPTPLAPLSSEAERTEHKAFMDKIGGDDESTVWHRYWKKAARG